MDVRHLRYFVAVAEEQHFGRAAARLHIAQPPLSQQIRQLEANLGVLLFERTTRKVELTAAGAAYLARARQILASLDDAAREVQLVAAGSVGHLTIGCVGSATSSLLPTLSRHLATELPGVEFAFRGEMLVPDQIEALRTGAVDIALLRPPVTDRSLAVEPLRDDELMLATPSDHPLAALAHVDARELADTDLIVHSADRASVMYGVVMRMLRDAGIQPRIRYQVGETSTLVTLVAGGLGVAIVPAPVSALALDGVTYRSLRPTTTVGLALAYRAGRTEPHLTRSLDVIKRLTATKDVPSQHLSLNEPKV
ncbi:DNA-binding transcriptional LysR family regulator [Nocardia kruczakiae]|uniref:DNA-binding transcriptional LysR family regulator n=1 Tax=Nocardia kruczakiae TaxID=261477 RepID=A0ABU1XPS3_9NOCA|nr:LysR family transcriptional regulator [Nocardia kruczakiae]MDR7172354.1 DNA-binding transcriptional LysR family regulator [Nocardia kruczakiae]